MKNWTLFPSFQKNISNGNSVYYVLTANTFRLRVATKLRFLEVYCVVFKPLQKWEHAVFDTKFKQRISN